MTVLPSLTAAEAQVDAEEARRARAQRTDSIAKWVLPLLVFVIMVVGWDRLVVWNAIPHYKIGRAHV